MKLVVAEKLFNRAFILILFLQPPLKEEFVDYSHKDSHFEEDQESANLWEGLHQTLRFVSNHDNLWSKVELVAHGLSLGNRIQWIVVVLDCEVSCKGHLFLRRCLTK